MTDYLAILPEISLLVLALIVLGLDLQLKKERKGVLPWVTFVGLVGILALTLLFNRPDGQELIWFGMLRDDAISFAFRLVFLIGAAVTALLSINWAAIRSLSPGTISR